MRIGGIAIVLLVGAMAFGGCKRAGKKREKIAGEHKEMYQQDSAKFTELIIKRDAQLMEMRKIDSMAHIELPISRSLESLLSPQEISDYFDSTGNSRILLFKQLDLSGVPDLRLGMFVEVFDTGQNYQPDLAIGVDDKLVNPDSLDNLYFITRLEESDEPWRSPLYNTKDPRLTFRTKRNELIHKNLTEEDRKTLNLYGDYLTHLEFVNLLKQELDFLRDKWMGRLN